MCVRVYNFEEYYTIVFPFNGLFHFNVIFFFPFNENLDIRTSTASLLQLQPPPLTPVSQIVFTSTIPTSTTKVLTTLTTAKTKVTPSPITSPYKILIANKTPHPRVKYSECKIIDEKSHKKIVKSAAIVMQNNAPDENYQMIKSHMVTVTGQATPTLKAINNNVGVTCLLANTVTGPATNRLQPITIPLSMPITIPFANQITLPISTTITLPMSTTITPKTDFPVVINQQPVMAQLQQHTTIDAITSMSSIQHAQLPATSVSSASSASNVDTTTATTTVKYADIDDIEFPDGSKIGYPTDIEIKRMQDGDISTLAEKYSVLAANALKNFDFPNADGKQQQQLLTQQQQQQQQELQQQLQQDQQSVTAGESADESLELYACRHCGKRYRWKSTLRRHENDECGNKEPSHQCPYCPYKAKQRGNLGVHLRKHHKDMPQLESRRKKKPSTMMM